MTALFRPTLQLTPTERPIFQCQQCGFLNTLIPMCLWCCWTSDAAHDEFYRSAPPRRLRRLSAPPRVMRTPTPNITLKSPPQNGEQYIPIPVEQQTTPDRGTNTNATPLPPSGDAIGTVTTPTISIRPSIKSTPSYRYSFSSSDDDNGGEGAPIPHQNPPPPTIHTLLFPPIGR